MSNKMQIRCWPNQFAVRYINHLEGVLETQYLALKELDQKIKKTNEEIDYYKNHPNTFLEDEEYQIIPNAFFEIDPIIFFENKKIFLLKRRSIISSSYQGHCKLVREYKSKLCIC